MRGLNNLSIIIAEDDVDDGEIIHRSFTRHPSFSKVHWVKNGKELMDLLHTPGFELPDVILTDINMPILNGLEVMERVFNDPHLCSIPVFAYSSTMNPLYESRCKALGCKAFLVKPFSLLEFDEIPYQLVYLLNKGR
jgi:CheY-like chemotaxis protein